MDDQRIKKLVNECKQLEEDSTYTAEAHYLHAAHIGRKVLLLKFAPALITIISAGILTAYTNSWFAWIAVLSGALTIFNVLSGPEKKANEHLMAAKHFTIMKHEARSLHEAFSDFLESEHFYHVVSRLREKYNMLALFSPATNNKKLWNMARENIKKGIHIPDFKCNS